MKKKNLLSHKIILIIIELNIFYLHYSLKLMNTLKKKKTTH